MVRKLDAQNNIKKLNSRLESSDSFIEGKNVARYDQIYSPILIEHPKIGIATELEAQQVE